MIAMTKLSLPPKPPAKLDQDTFNILTKTNLKASRCLGNLTQLMARLPDVDPFLVQYMNEEAWFLTPAEKLRLPLEDVFDSCQIEKLLPCLDENSRTARVLVALFLLDKGFDKAAGVYLFYCRKKTAGNDWSGDA
jgi:Fic family protein